MRVDALVVGAGPAGLAAATRLATLGAAVAVAEARPRGGLRQPGEHLPPSGLRAVAEAGFGAALDDPRHGRSPGVRSRWGGGATEDRDYFFTAPGRGANLDRRAFDAAMTARAERAGARLVFGARLDRLERAGSGVCATLRGAGAPIRVSAGIVVDASGRRAVAARRLGAATRRLDRLVGVMALIGDAPPDDAPGRLRIEAVEDGWWYRVRLAHGATVATFMTDAGTVAAHPGGPRGLWLARAAAFGLRDGAEAPCPPVRVFDAATQTLFPGFGPGFLAIGDAAAAYDPLSSWGIAKGVADGDAAARALAAAVSGRDDALAAHDAARRAAFERYRAARRDAYAAEDRWPDAPFWRARRAAAPSEAVLEGASAP